VDWETGYSGDPWSMQTIRRRPLNDSAIPWERLHGYDRLHLWSSWWHRVYESAGTEQWERHLQFMQFMQLLFMRPGIKSQLIHRQFDLTR